MIMISANPAEPGPRPKWVPQMTRKSALREAILVLRAGPRIMMSHDLT
jgi:hypothetical protein